MLGQKSDGIVTHDYVSWLKGEAGEMHPRSGSKQTSVLWSAYHMGTTWTAGGL